MALHLITPQIYFNAFCFAKTLLQMCTCGCVFLFIFIYFFTATFSRRRSKHIFSPTVRIVLFLFVKKTVYFLYVFKMACPIAVQYLTVEEKTHMSASSWPNTNNQYIQFEYDAAASFLCGIFGAKKLFAGNGYSCLGGNRKTGATAPGLLFDTRSRLNFYILYLSLIYLCGGSKYACLSSIVKQ